MILLKFSYNQIEKLPVFDLPNLEELYLNKNKINSFQCLFESKLDNL